MIPVCKSIGKSIVFQQAIENVDSDLLEGLGGAGDSAFLASSQATPLAQEPHFKHQGFRPWLNTVVTWKLSDPTPDELYTSSWGSRGISNPQTKET